MVLALSDVFAADHGTEKQKLFSSNNVPLMCTGVHAVTFIHMQGQWSLDSPFKEEGGYLLQLPVEGQNDTRLLLPEWPKDTWEKVEDIRYNVTPYKIEADYTGHKNMALKEPALILGHVAFNRITGEFSTLTQVIIDNEHLYAGFRSSGTCARAAAPRF